MEEHRTSTIEALLGVLSVEPMSGYEMRQFMERSTTNFWSESYGQIYPSLRRMAAEGLVESVDAGTVEMARAKKVYRITAAGQERLRAWLGVPAKPQVRRHDLLLKVFFGDRAEPGAMAQHVADWQEKFAADRARYEEIAARLERSCAGQPALPYWQMTLRYGIEEAKFFERWSKETLAELKRLDAEKTRQPASADQGSVAAG